MTPPLSASIDTRSRLAVRRGASFNLDAEAAVDELFEQLDQPDIALALFYCSPKYDLGALGVALARRFGDVQLIGSTSAGEITPAGYRDGSLTGVSIGAADFTAVAARLDDLTNFELSDGTRLAQEALDLLRVEAPPADTTNAFGLLLIDGLSKREELVVSSVHRGLGEMQLFGGSAGDGLDFGETFVYHDGAFHTNAAVLALVHTTHPFVLFKTQHFVASDTKMVVTGADVAERRVTEINGVPAGREYARLVGLDFEQLDPMIFAAHPVMVRVGGEDFVRSIMQVHDDESLSFACAIDEGIVLTVAKGIDMLDNLRRAFDDVRQRLGPPEVVFGCDCLFRAIEMDQKDLRNQVSEIMAENNVIGLSTYGEQFNSMHVNQTFTGVAIGAIT